MDSNFYKVLESVELDRLRDMLDERNKMDGKLVRYATPVCPHCKTFSVMMVSERGLENWLNGVHIQDAFVDMPADEREMLKTGIHPECWVALFNETA